MSERGHWGSSIGFILAAMGSAIGFGSISRFPMNVANNGGAAFLLVYALAMLLVGIPMLIAEFSIGRAAQKNPAGAFDVLEQRPRSRWRLAGAFFFILSAFFLSWYSVIAGWVLRYIFGAATGAYTADPAAYQFEALEGPDALLGHFAVMGLAFIVLTTKVSKGIERLNLVLMPTLFLIVIGLAIYAATLPGVAPGYAFYLRPDFSRLSLPVFAAVIGQTFFSLGIGMGTMMTYASYLPKSEGVARNAAIISFSTLGFAFLAGLMLFPLLAAFGLLGTGAAGLDLIFGPMAMAFVRMGTLGLVLGGLFFLATFFAAFTSVVSLAEPAISYVHEEHGVDRRRSALLVCTLIYLAGVAAAFSVDLVSFEGGALTDALLIAGGLLIALYVGWRSDARVARARMDEGRGIRLGWLAFPLVRYVMPVILVVLLLFAILGTPCALTGGAPGGGLAAQIFGLRGLGCPG
ncbi:MAG TPA: sodium-dependent transporter [Candidatus Thermoplasmatota archaeon]|nr:sodium-dependent transporter [Candidatus Thermoplasmatota archaeon]